MKDTAQYSNILTPAKFAKKHGLARTTVWRWLTDKDQEKRLKMYDARKVTIAGKKFIEILVVSG